MKKYIMLFLVLTSVSSAQFPMVAAWQSAAFSPTQLDSIAAWYDASDIGIAKPSGDTTYYVQDKSGNGRHMYQLTDASKPLYIDSSGTKMLRFDGVNDFMSGTLVAPGSNYSFFVAVRLYSTVGTTLPYYTGASSTNGFGPLLFGNNRSVLHGGAGGALKQDGAATLNREIWSAVHQSWTTMRVGADTVSLSSSGAPYNAPTGSSYLGGNAAGANSWRGAVYEVIVYTRRLSAVESLQVISYLQSKWGI